MFFKVLSLPQCPKCDYVTVGLGTYSSKLVLLLFTELGIIWYPDSYPSLSTDLERGRNFFGTGRFRLIIHKEKSFRLYSNIGSY